MEQQLTELFSGRLCGIWQNRTAMWDAVAWIETRLTFFRQPSSQKSQRLRRHSRTRKQVYRRMLSVRFVCRSSCRTRPCAHCPAFIDSIGTVLINGSRYANFHSFFATVCWHVWTNF